MDPVQSFIEKTPHRKVRPGPGIEHRAFSRSWFLEDQIMYEVALGVKNLITTGLSQTFFLSHCRQILTKGNQLESCRCFWKFVLEFIHFTNWLIALLIHVKGIAFTHWYPTPQLLRCKWGRDWPTRLFLVITRLANATRLWKSTLKCHFGNLSNSLTYLILITHISDTWNKIMKIQSPELLSLWQMLAPWFLTD